MSKRNARPETNGTKPRELKDENLDAARGAGETAGIFSGKGGWAGVKGGNNEVGSDADKPLSGTDLGSSRVK